MFGFNKAEPFVQLLYTYFILEKKEPIYLQKNQVQLKSIPSTPSITAARQPLFNSSILCVWYQKITVFRHTIKNQTVLCKMLLLHTTYGFVFEMFNTFFQNLFWDNASNESHQTHNLMYLHGLLGASLQPVQSAAPQGIIPWNDIFSLLRCTSATKKGRISNHPAQKGEMDNTQSWLFQCQMITNTTADCSIRHLTSEARKNRQLKPKNYRMWFFSTVNR